MNAVAILGAGAFGTALASALSRPGRPVTLWGRDPPAMAEIARTRENARHLPGLRLPPDVTATAEPATLAAADIVLLAVPTQTLAGVLAAHGAALAARTLVACCKGIELGSGLGPAGLIARALPGARAALLTGPGFAADIGAGLPTALTLACADDALGAALQAALAGPVIRLYRTSDVAGAELGGALKNVIAIAAGLTIGAGLGDSARAAVLTRGFAEMVRLATACGARAETLAGLSGLGDLVLTCTSEKSRNFTHGVALGRGAVPAAGVTVEGVATATAALALARGAGVEMPLARTVAEVCAGTTPLNAAIAGLMARPLKEE